MLADAWVECLENANIERIGPSRRDRDEHVAATAANRTGDRSRASHACPRWRARGAATLATHAWPIVALGRSIGAGLIDSRNPRRAGSTWRLRDIRREARIVFGRARLECDRVLPDRMCGRWSRRNQRRHLARRAASDDPGFAWRRPGHDSFRLEIDIARRSARVAGLDARLQHRRVCNALSPLRRAQCVQHGWPRVAATKMALA